MKSKFTTSKKKKRNNQPTNKTEAVMRFVSHEDIYFIAKC